MKIANITVSWKTIYTTVKTGLPLVLQAAALVEQSMQQQPSNDLAATIAYSVAAAALASRTQHPVIKDMVLAVQIVAAATHPEATPPQTNVKS